MPPSLSLTSAAAFAQDVKTDFDKDANFAAIKTFAVKIGTSWNNQISEKRVSDEIAAARSPRRAGQSADGREGRRASWCSTGATEKQQTLNTFYSGGGYGGYGWRGWHGHGHGHRHHHHVRSTSWAPWSWTSSTRRPRPSCSGAPPTDELSDKPEKNIKKLAKASDKLFKNFPPGSEKKK